MIICVVGPTGVGKTKLSEELALKYDAIVVNCDAMQIYKELNIGTAKIKDNEKKVKEHFLFDIRKPDEEYSVYEYQVDARSLIEKYKNRNIVFVGGTGLYLKAALFNYEFEEFPEKNEYDDYTNEELYDLLKVKNPELDVHVNNRRRLISKLNNPFNTGLKDELLYSNVHIIGLTAPKEILYDKLNNRVEEMIEEGLLIEVRYLYKKYGKTKALSRGICYKEVIAYFEGKVTYDEMIRLLKQANRKYAKRQYTWFNHQMDISWFTVDYSNFNNTIKDVMNYIDTSN